MSLITVGSLAFDTIQTLEGRAEKVLGGSMNYFSIAASLFHPVSIVGVVGEDFPKEHLLRLENRNINTSGVEFKSGKTFHWEGSYEKSFNEAETLKTALNVFETFQPKLSQEQRKCPVAFLANIDPIIQLDLLKQLESTDFIACDTMNYWIHSKKPELLKVLAQVDLLSINEAEAYLLTGEKQLRQAARVIQSYGPKALILKRGEYGSAVFCNEEIFLVPAFPVEKVVDPTGAGDSFAGGLLGVLASHGVSRKDITETDGGKNFFRTLKKAALTASALASFTVESFSFEKLITASKRDVQERQEALLKWITA